MGVEVVTFGCRLNAAESETMRSQAEAAGRDATVIVNTCAVTAEATRQARQTIRKIARERPEARIVVTGCAAQVEPERFATLPGVSRVVGNHEKLPAETWSRLPSAGKVQVADIMAVRETGTHPLGGMRGRTRAFVPVQNGCDHRCTFCVIPYGRGNSRSVPMGAVVEQVRATVEGGTREVVLTGVDITSYGRDLPGAPKLGTLVKAILRHVPELKRLRLSSIDSIEQGPAMNTGDGPPIATSPTITTERGLASRLAIMNGLWTVCVRRMPSSPNSSMGRVPATPMTSPPRPSPIPWA